MTFVTSQSPAPAPAKPAIPPRFKYRARFRKTQDLRLVSHHDLMHVCERMFRRAELSIPVTHGFNPRPRMWFASAMALGVAGLNEVLEFELAEPLQPTEVQRRLSEHAPPGLEITSVREIDVRASAQVRRAMYRLPLRTEGASAEFVARVGTPTPEPRPRSLLDRIADFLAKTEIWVERLRPQPRRVNIRPFVDVLRVNGEYLEMALWITSNGAARPNEIIAELGLQPLLDDGAVIERSDLELEDEFTPKPAGVPADLTTEYKEPLKPAPGAAH